MEKLKEYKYIIIIVLVIMVFTFYWFQLRPTQIKRGCADIAIEKINSNNSGRNYVPIAERVDNNQTDFRNYFERCLTEKGL